MSGSQAKEARRSAGRVAHAVLDIAIVPGACVDLPEQVASMRKQTHDGIIELTGTRRRSGVSWRQFHGQTDCLRGEVPCDACVIGERTYQRGRPSRPSRKRVAA